MARRPNQINFAETFLNTFAPGFRQGRQDAIDMNKWNQEFAAKQQAQQFQQQMRQRQEDRTAELHPFAVDRARMGVEGAKLGLESDKLTLGEQQFKADVRPDVETFKAREEEELARKRAAEDLNALAKRMGIKLTAAQIAKLNRESQPPPRRIAITEQEFVENPKKIMDQIDNLPIDNAGKNYLRKEAAKAHTLVQKKALINKTFDRVKELSGKESAKTILGSIPGLRRMFPDAYSAAQEQGQAASFFLNAILGIRSSEPNAIKQQAISTRLSEIDMLDPDKKLEAQKQLLLELTGTMRGAEALSAIAGYGFLDLQEGKIGSTMDTPANLPGPRNRQVIGSPPPATAPIPTSPTRASPPPPTSTTFNTRMRGIK